MRFSLEKKFAQTLPSAANDLLAVAQNNYEKAICYLIKSEASYDRRDYLDAIVKGKKSKELIGNSDRIPAEIDYTECSYHVLSKSWSYYRI
ncbi:hypothetical protein [Chryseobacterium sp.]|uniref:hypothetical protein n=1 Tax=Chryseobacterium sp. TaxID=1871047 RepID=UPI003890323C